MPSGFLKRILDIGKSNTEEPVRPAVAGPPISSPAISSRPEDAAQGTPLPGNFYSFEFFIELTLGDAVHLGYPKFCIRYTSTGLVRWGSKIEWAWPDPAKRRIAWLDDEHKGLKNKSLTTPDDALGAEGAIGDMRLRFERILDYGKNQIVYALYCPEKNIRLAYGFDRGIFQAK
jgi:hypothetical protein